MSTLSDVVKAEVLEVACAAAGIPAVKLMRVDRFRWFLEDRPGLGPSMIKLEKLVQRATGHPIDLRVEPKADKNKRFDRNYLRKVEKLEG